MRDEHLGPDLIAYLDGELPSEAEARVEAHLAQCPACAAELEELRRMQVGVDTTLASALSSVHLSRDAEDRIRAVLRQQVERRPGWLRQFWRLRMPVAQAILAMLLVAFSAGALRVARLPAPAVSQETVVLGQRRLAPGSQAALRVIVRTAGATTGAASAPVMGLVEGAEVFVKLLLPGGDEIPLFRGATGSLGTTSVAFTVPEIEEGTADLLVETRSAVGVERVVRPVEIVRSHKIYLMTDKPAYRPGQAIHLRALALDAVSLRPAMGTLQFRILDALGDPLEQAEVPISPYGVAVWDVVLPEDVVHGTFRLMATLGDTVSERAVSVEDYRLPPFDVQLNTERTFYAPGDVVSGTVEASYFYGLPVASANVVVHAYAGGAEDGPWAEVDGELHEDGTFHFAFTLPSNLTNRFVTLAAQITDMAGRVAGIRAVVPVSEQEIFIQALPESGLLKPGVDNVVYVMTTYPDGAPASATLQVRTDDERLTVKTGLHGLATFSLKPEGPMTLRIEAHDDADLRGSAEIDLKSDAAARTLLLHIPGAAYEAGSTLRATALLPADVAAEAGVVYLDVVRVGQMVAAMASPVTAGRATFDLDLDPAMTGALELRSYVLLDGGTRIEDTRVVVVDPARDLEVRIASDREQHQPGDVARLDIETVDGLSGDPLVAVVGVSVVDASVFALETLPPSFARAYFLTNEAMLVRRDRVAGLDLPALIDAEDVDDEQLKAVQDVAARAAWAGAPVEGATLRASAITTPPDPSRAARQSLSRWLAAALTGLPLLLAVVVVRQWRHLGLLYPALQRLGWAMLAMVLIAPLLVAGLVIGLLLPWLGAVLFFLLLGLCAVLLLIVVVHGWARHDPALQFFGSLVIVYLVLAGLWLGLAARDITIGPLALASVVGAFLVLVLASTLLGQGVVLSGRRAMGWATTMLALFLALLAVTAPAVPALRSDLTQAVSNPALYVGPLGWLSGCAGAPTGVPASEPALTDAPTEEPAAEEEMGEAPSPAPTSRPYPTATLPTVPLEPYPLRQVFPETLYWGPEIETGNDGRVSLDLALADNITAWRVTALASTRDGRIGSGSYDLPVSQDLFVEITPPPEVRAGDLVTLTLRVTNLLPETQIVRWDVVAAGDIADLSPPASLRVGALSSAGTVLAFRPETSGSLPITVAALSESAADRVQIELQVEPASP